jgi:hypothetical protein
VSECNLQMDGFCGPCDDVCDKFCNGPVRMSTYPSTNICVILEHLVYCRLDSIVPVMDHQDLSASTLLKESSVFGIVQWEDMQ